ncbi:MAG: lysophospholipid acyltransferase family protein [Elusimicrobia bacterium]|nr:lysophospholipid acyltransferase family protein [Elusimicrobiota bacterium]
MTAVLDWEDDARPWIPRLLAGLTALLARRVWRLRVVGLERVPRSGAVILACNHVSNADPPILGAAVFPARSPRFLAKIELFRAPGLGWLMRRGGAIPLDRGRPDVGAMRSCLEMLRRGRLVAVFPEGTRARRGRPLPPKTGVAFLAARSGAPVVPARIVGSDRLARLGRLEVRFGAPLRFEGDAADYRACRDFARLVMEAVFSL